MSGMGNGERDNALASAWASVWSDPFASAIAIDEQVVRTFDSGANRDLEDGKLDYEGFLSPLVLERYAEYMHEHRALKDGSLRESDNWQKGMPKEVYMKSMWRHFMDVWTGHREGQDYLDGQEEALCALLFNVMGYLYELRRS